MEESGLFFIDNQALDDNGVSETFKSPFPIFSSAKLVLDTEEDAGESSETSESDEDDEYFGLPSPSVRIKDALGKCPFKVEHFKSTSSSDETTSSKFNDRLLNALDDYLSELRPKKYSFATDGIETKTDITKFGLSENQLQKLNRKEREKTNGTNWFNMKAPEVTDELKNDIQILQMRSALDPKHFYKRNEMKTVPKYFEMGQVMESPVEYHNSKNVRKTKRSLVDELLEDAEFQKYNKRKFQETVELKKKAGFNKAMKKMRKLKKKKT